MRKARVVEEGGLAKNESNLFIPSEVTSTANEQPQGGYGSDRSTKQIY